MDEMAKNNEVIPVDENIKLIPYFPCSNITLGWYQDYDVCKQVDNIDYLYDEETLNRMYTYLNNNGSLFYIEYKGILVGDITLLNNSEISIVVSKPYQNMHIGRKCLLEVINLARLNNMKKVYARIYSFNTQSIKMFKSMGFNNVENDIYELIF